MNLLFAITMVVLVTGAAVTAMLIVRRRAPEGGFVADGDRAAGVFGVIATGFSVLLGFLIFLAFESYDSSRAGGEAEAQTVAQQVQTAQLLPDEVKDDLTGQLVCYARWVVEDEWARMVDGTLNEELNPWSGRMFLTLHDVDLATPVEQSAYDLWLQQTSDRIAGRQERIHGAAGVMPTPLWIVLFFITGLVVLFIFAFADSSERAWVQALYMGSIVATIVSMLLLLNFLDDAFHPGIGGLQPDAMRRSLVLIDEQLEVLQLDLTPPCDAAGQPHPVTVAQAPERRDWVEIFATVLLSLAAVATAWSSYQAARWNGEQAKTASRANHVRVEAARAQGLAEAQKEIDVATFIQWVDATAHDDTELADFYEERFRDELQPAFHAWLDTDPLVAPDAPPTPFAMDEYQLDAETQARELDAQEQVLAAQVRRNIQRATNYMLGVVLFAVSLFFAGISTKLDGRGSRIALLVMGTIVFLGTAVWIATSPISVAISGS